MKKSWNPILNKVIELKELYEKTFGELKDEDYLLINNGCYKYGFDDKTPCIVTWYEKLKETNVCLSDFPDFFKYLSMDQEGDLISFKYNKLAIYNRVLYPSSSIYREARGLVINVRKMELVLTPFKKFFNVNEIEYIRQNNLEVLKNNPYNYDEDKLKEIAKQTEALTNETSLDVIKEKMKKAKVVEWTNKFDGSMISMRYYDNKIVIASSSRIEQKGNRHAYGARKLLQQKHIDMMKENSNITFIFEYIDESDKHIVKYDFNDIVLIGMRNVTNGELISYADLELLAKKHNIRHTSVEHLSLNNVLNDMKTLVDANKEGWVLNIDSQQYKFKLEDYFQVHKLLYAISENQVIRFYADGKYDDLIAQFDNVDEIKKIESVIDVCNEYINLYKEVLTYYQTLIPIDKRQMSTFLKELPSLLSNNIFKKENINPLILKASKNQNNNSYVKFGLMERNIESLKKIKKEKGI